MRKRTRSRQTAFFVVALVVLGTSCRSAGEEKIEISHVHGVGIDSESVFVATHHGLYAYEDGEWSRRSSDSADHMGFSMASEQLMFRSGHPETGGNLGVQRSTDGGGSWEDVADVLDSPVDFHAMAASRSSPPTLYGWSGRLYRSIGDPREWEPVQASGLPSRVGALAVGEDGDVFASTARGLYRSPEGGGRWKAVSDDLVFALATGEDVIYASKGRGPGVLRSTNGGRTWKDAGDGLGSAPIVALAASADGERVAAADQEATIWQSDNGGDTWTEIPTP